MEWIKVKTSVFNDPRWFAMDPSVIESAENMYIRLLVLAGIAEEGGRLMIYDDCAHTIDTIAAMTRKDKALVAHAMDVLLGFGFLVKDSQVYAIANWDRLQFIGDPKTREQDRQRKRKSPPDSTPESTPESTTESKGEEDEEKDGDKNNNNAVVLDLAKELLQKIWPQMSINESVIETVAKALASKGEDYVNDNIDYVRLKAKDNPVKYLIDALSNDYAAHQQKKSNKTIALADRKWQAEAEKQQREEEDEKLRRWQASPEGQIELERLRNNGFALPDPTPQMQANESKCGNITSTVL